MIHGDRGLPCGLVNVFQHGRDPGIGQRPPREGAGRVATHCPDEHHARATGSRAHRLIGAFASDGGVPAMSQHCFAGGGQVFDIQVVVQVHRADDDDGGIQSRLQSMTLQS